MDTALITRSGEKAATQSQFDYIKSLLAERDLTDDMTKWVNDARHFAVIGDFSSKAASQLIDALLFMPKKSEPRHFAPEAGIYQHGHDLFRVYLGQQNGHMLVKRILVSHDTMANVDNIDGYEYLGRASRFLPVNARRLSLEDVGALGRTFDHCLLCGRRLDDPESVDRGIGPVCATKY